MTSMSSMLPLLAMPTSIADPVVGHGFGHQPVVDVRWRIFQFNQDISGWNTASVTGHVESVQVPRLPATSLAGTSRASPDFGGLFSGTSPAQTGSLVHQLVQPTADRVGRRKLFRTAVQIQFHSLPAALSIAGSAARMGFQYYGTNAADARVVLVNKGWAIADGGPAVRTFPELPSGVSLRSHRFGATVVDCAS